MAKYYGSKVISSRFTQNATHLLTGEDHREISLLRLHDFEMKVC